MLLLSLLIIAIHLHKSVMLHKSGLYQTYHGTTNIYIALLSITCYTFCRYVAAKTAAVLSIKTSSDDDREAKPGFIITNRERLRNSLRYH